MSIFPPLGFGCQILHSERNSSESMKDVQYNDEWASTVHLPALVHIGGFIVGQKMIHCALAVYFYSIPLNFKPEICHQHQIAGPSWPWMSVLSRQAVRPWLQLCYAKQGEKCFTSCGMIWLLTGGRVWKRVNSPAIIVNQRSVIQSIHGLDTVTNTNSKIRYMILSLMADFRYGVTRQHSQTLIL